MTDMQQRAQEACDYQIVIDAILDMAVESSFAAATEILRDDVAEGFVEPLLDSRRDSSIQPLFDYLIEMGEDIEDVHLQLAEMANLRPELMGICLQISTPVRQKVGNYVKSSWCRCKVAWVYGDTYEKAWERAVAWAKEHK